MMILAEPFIHLWLGDDFKIAVSITQILIASFLMNSLHLVANSMFAGIGRPGRYLILHLVWAVSNIGLSIALAPRYGLSGIALGTAIPVMILEPLYVRLACQAFGARYRDFLRSVVLGTVISSLVATAALFAILLSGHTPTNWIELGASGAVYIAVYLGTFWFVGADPIDRAYILSLIQLRRTQRSVLRDG